jgi:hypothetical protein
MGTRTTIGASERERHEGGCKEKGWGGQLPDFYLASGDIENYGVGSHGATQRLPIDTEAMRLGLCD